MGARVRFMPNDVEVEVDGAETLEQAFARARLSVFIGCRGGGCGVCRVRVSGPVELGKISKNRLDDDDRRAGVVLACKAVPLGDVTITREDGAPFARP
ncbi:MAG: 2Fe-2S iron-sulfur cluster binding domain-containing protein [Labilithrix sp.]|nr:2Fe-2S iron-sulfur cluster binding domain-containing protein [Labilithrix sp.]